ncbi:glycosyltransferase family 2 protein [Patescibacteria group bacterium]|nr:glycosyltransferase family 2 protein [Patescibacteria group bacterium]MBU4511810.1 glycosyltransferase family 2 protein [Patescibacteria group bacterium]MCG2692560.1 glycosyltransferase family 2 protein [Candidatus Parcubacteria bacterium]
MKQLSIIVPAYNEEKSINEVLNQLKCQLADFNIEHEIIVVNDGSNDQTKELLKKISCIKPINHPYNKGYGASLKTGVKNAKYDWVMFYDADGQHNPKYISELLKHTNEYDMIIGARQGYQGPWLRQPGKKILHLAANYLSGHKIPDLNSGFRLIKRKHFLRFAHLFPDGFSLTTTITLTFFKTGLNVKYVPITINKRQGKSSVKPADAVNTFMLIVRLITLFSPLRIFLPLTFVLFLLTIFLLVNDILSRNISDSTILLFVSTILIFFFGIMVDQIAAIRRELK